MINNDRDKSAKKPLGSAAGSVSGTASGASTGDAGESSSKLQRYLDRQKNSQTAAEFAEPSLQNFNPQFGLNSAYLMWALETLSQLAKVEFRNWRTRRHEQKIKAALDAEKVHAEAARSAAQAASNGGAAYTGGASLDTQRRVADHGGPTDYGSLAVNPARPLTWAHAEFGVRLIAVIIDWIILAMLRTAIMRLTSQNMFGGIFSGLLGQDEAYQSSANGFTQSFYWNILPTNFFLMWTALKIPYYGFFYSQRGASPGKLAMGLQVIDARTGRFLTPWVSIFRETIGTMLSWAIVSIGYLMAAIRYDRRAFHDLLFESVVVRVPPQILIKPPAA